MSEFTSEEVNVIKQTLKERYGEQIDVQLADVELRLDEGDRELVARPAVYWEVKGCHFVISKIDDNHFYSQFYYAGSQQFGTGIKKYDDIVNCVVTLLQVQADHELNEKSTDSPHA